MDAQVIPASQRGQQRFHRRGGIIARLHLEFQEPWRIQGNETRIHRLAHLGDQNAFGAGLLEAQTHGAARPGAEPCTGVETTLDMEVSQCGIVDTCLPNLGGGDGIAAGIGIGGIPVEDKQGMTLITFGKKVLQKGRGMDIREGGTVDPAVQLRHPVGA